MFRPSLSANATNFYAMKEERMQLAKNTGPQLELSFGGVILYVSGDYDYNVRGQSY